MASLTGPHDNVWSGAQPLPVFNLERYTATNHVLFNVPWTPGDRLRIDIVRRLDALNRKELARIKKQNEQRMEEHQREVRNWERKEAKRLRKQEKKSKKCGLKWDRLRQRSSSFDWKSRSGGLGALIREIWDIWIMPGINAAFRFVAFLSWVVQHARGRAFAVKMSIFMP